MIKMIVHGLGRLGRSVCRLAADSAEFEVVAGIDILQETADFLVFAALGDCDAEADVLVDCSTAAAVSGFVRAAVNARIPAVICTTALDDAILQEINEAAGQIPIFLSANMALGVNLMSKLARAAAKVLAEAGFDIEIIEKHHRGKVDAPSGTANYLADGIIETLGYGDLVYDRSGERRPRMADEIGIHSVRGGAIAGEHSVFFAGEGETLEIAHVALSREVFAQGVLRAVKFIATKPPGLYNMDDLLQ